MFKPRYARVRPVPDQPVQVQVMGPGLLEIVRARDLSRSGLALAIPDGFPELEPDREVELVILLPERRPVRAAGEVRHVTELFTERFLGVELVEMAEAHRAALEDYVADRLRDEEPPRAGAAPSSSRRPGS